MAEFTQDLDLDAKLVFAGMQGGMDGIMKMAFMEKDKISANDVVARCEWLKTQPPEYVDQVVALVVTKEKELKNEN